MATTTATEAATKQMETLSLSTDGPTYKHVPGGYEVEHAGKKWFTGTLPNLDYEPPKDFKFPGNTVNVPLNPKGQTEMPQKLYADYTDVSRMNRKLFDE